MKKIKKVDPRLGQSVLSFGCPCASCYLYSCPCVSGQKESTSAKYVWTNDATNRSMGGSLVGGGGR